MTHEVATPDGMAKVSIRPTVVPDPEYGKAPAVEIIIEDQINDRGITLLPTPQDALDLSTAIANAIEQTAQQNPEAWRDYEP